MAAPWSHRSSLFLAASLLIIAGSLPARAAGWVNVTNNLGGVPDECGGVGHSFKVPGTATVIAGVAGDGLWATSDRGATWAKLGGTSGNAIKNRPTQMIFDPSSPETWWECGIYTAPGVFKTTDGGATWSPLGTIAHHDGMAVDLSDPQRRTLLAGGHEQSNTLYKSTDGGSTWTNIGGNLPGGTGYASYPYIVSAQIFLMGISTSGGIYRSTDGGASWNKVCNQNASSPILKSSAGDLYCAGGSGTMLKGDADGATWTSVTCGTSGSAPVELPGGRFAALSNNGVLISADRWTTWKTVASPLPSQITAMLGGMVYDEVGGAFYAWHWDCAPTTVASDVMWRYDTVFAATTRVTRSSITSLFDGTPPDASHDIGVSVFDAAGRAMSGRSMPANRPAPRDGLYFVKSSDRAAFVRVVR
jgi:photosystem II stability/assembly factor-like uncharacterized protein